MTPVLRQVRIEGARAWRRLQRYGYDPRDVRQELLLHWFRRSRYHDSRRSSEPTFAARVCRNRAVHLVEALTSQKRGAGAIVESLSDAVQLGDHTAVERSETISQDDYHLAIGRQSRPGADLLELCIDVNRAVSHLRPELAAVARLLEQGETRMAIARRLGLSRSTIHRRIARLHDAFLAAGLDKYVGQRRAA